MGNVEALINLGIDLRGRTSGQVKVICPKCRQLKPSTRDLDMSVSIDEGVFNCKKPSCGYKGSVNTRNLPEKKTYRLPEAVNNTNLSDLALKWFQARGISSKTLIDMGIYSKMEWMPQTGKEESCIVFPYKRDRSLVNNKFRDAAKHMKLERDAELVLYNIDCLKSEDDFIYICEGEIDALSFIECGITNVVSVPNGAPPVNSQYRLPYLESAADLLSTKNKFILAGDKDEPGKGLTNELARRLDCIKCWTVDWDDCKDANEFLVKYKQDAFIDRVTSPQPFPLPDITTVADIHESMSNLYTDGLKQGPTIGIPDFDDIISFTPGYMTTTTGEPGSGKSEAIDFITLLLALIYDSGVGVFSPENRPIEYHVSKLAEKLIGKPFYGFNRMSKEELYQAECFLNEHYFFIQPEEDLTLDSILDKATKLVLRYGIKYLILDPWNKFEHLMNPGENETQYTSRALDKILKFAIRYGVHVFLIAHPIKLRKNDKTGKYPVASLYDISGSAAFNNKTDIGLSVYRDYDTGEIQFHFLKRRFKHWGKTNKAINQYIRMYWDSDNGRYYSSVPDTSNWLIKFKKS